MPGNLIVLFEKQGLIIILVFSQIYKQIVNVKCKFHFPKLSLLSDFVTFGSGLYLSVEFFSQMFFFYSCSLLIYY